MVFLVLVLVVFIKHGLIVNLVVIENTGVRVHQNILKIDYMNNIFENNFSSCLPIQYLKVRTSGDLLLLKTMLKMIIISRVM